MAAQATRRNAIPQIKSGSLFGVWLDRFSDASQELEQTANKLWSLVDEGITMAATCENVELKPTNLKKAIKDMRELYLTSSEALDKIRSFVTRVDAKSQQLSCAMENLRVKADEVARQHGLDLLPDEILLRILVDAFRDWDDRWAASRVCKRFHFIMMSTKILWKEYWLDSTMSPGQIQTIAKLQDFSCLKARLSDYFVDKQTRIRSTKAMLSLRQHLTHMDLKLLDDSLWADALSLLGEIDLPLLQSLRFSARFKDETLASRVCEILRTPSLKILHTSFIPPASFTTNIVEYSLTLRGIMHFARLSDFLKTLDSLRKLSLIEEKGGGIEVSGDQETGILSNVTNLSISIRSLRLGELLADKMRFPDLEDFSFTAEVNGESVYSSFMSNYPQIQSFRLSTPTVNLDLLFRSEPSTFKKLFIIGGANETSRWHLAANGPCWRVLEELHFCRTKRLTTSFIECLQALLRHAGHDSSSIIIGFEGCDGIRDGIFTVDTMESALR